MEGVVYQVESETDPLANPDQCKLDAALMKTLGVNTIRVYEVEYQRDHDDCMSSFADAGIYLFLGLETSETGFNRVNPDWTRAMFDNYTAVLDAFASYDNLLAVDVGNEVIQDG